MRAILKARDASQTASSGSPTHFAGLAAAPNLTRYPQRRKASPCTNSRSWPCRWSAFKKTSGDTGCWTIKCDSSKAGSGDTLPISAPIERLAILRLDGDLYESTIHRPSKACCYKLSVGGFVIVDDYGNV